MTTGGGGPRRREVVDAAEVDPVLWNINSEVLDLRRQLAELRRTLEEREAQLGEARQGSEGSERAVSTLQGVLTAMVLKGRAELQAARDEAQRTMVQRVAEAQAEAELLVADAAAALTTALGRSAEWSGSPQWQPETEASVTALRSAAAPWPSAPTPPPAHQWPSDAPPPAAAPWPSDPRPPSAAPPWPADTGLADTGLADTGLADTGLAAPPRAAGSDWSADTRPPPALRPRSSDVVPPASPEPTARPQSGQAPEGQPHTWPSDAPPLGRSWPTDSAPPPPAAAPWSSDPGSGAPIPAPSAWSSDPAPAPIPRPDASLPWASPTSGSGADPSWLASAEIPTPPDSQSSGEEAVAGSGGEPRHEAAVNGWGARSGPVETLGYDLDEQFRKIVALLPNTEFLTPPRGTPVVPAAPAGDVSVVAPPPAARADDSFKEFWPDGGAPPPPAPANGKRSFGFSLIDALLPIIAVTLVLIVVLSWLG